jgi:quercetin dioxygenase-like cupin family protein
MSSRSRFRKGKWTVIQVLAVLAVLVGSVIWARTSQATPPATPGSGVTLVTLADGRLPATVRVIVGANNDNKVARIQQYKITLAPGGTTGWHQHGGPHLIVVASGTLTYYKGDDPTCTGVQYPAGTSILDPGYTTPLARNEGTVDVVNYVTQLLPDPGIFRIDIPAPGNPHCGF